MSFSYVCSKQVHSFGNIGGFTSKHMAQRDQQGETRNNIFFNHVSKVVRISVQFSILWLSRALSMNRSMTTGSTYFTSAVSVLHFSLS